MSRSEILIAIQCHDWDTLRRISCQSNGLVAAREEAWRFMLGGASDSEEEFFHHKNASLPSLKGGTEPVSAAQDSDAASFSTPHSDERQVHLDTERSFVFYPSQSAIDRDRRKQQLENVIVSVLRKRPRLGYFQGYHDIVSVILLTFDPTPFGQNSVILKDAIQCVEKLSLHRVRDSMGTGLGPLIGQLRLLRRLMRLVDPELALVLERTSPLPYFALSNLLTLFSHDMPSLSSAQRVLDYLFSRAPIYSVYLAAAVVLQRKPDVLKLQREGDDGMIHAILSQLPALCEAEESDTLPPTYSDSKEILRRLPGSYSASSSTEETLVDTGSLSDVNRTVVAPTPSSPPLNHAPPRSNSLGIDHTEKSNSTSSQVSTLPSAQRSPKVDAIKLSSLFETADSLHQRFPPMQIQSSPSGSPGYDEIGSGEHDNPQDESAALPQTLHRSLDIEDIFKPNSVVFTWSQTPTLNDDEAEALLDPGLPEVVLPYDGASDRDLFESSKEKEREDGAFAAEEERRRRRRELLRTSAGVGIAVLVGVSAVVLYTVDRSLATQGGGGSSGQPKSLNDWFKTSAWAAGLVIGLGERVVGAF